MPAASEDIPWVRRVERVGPIVLGLAIVAFVSLNLTIGLHPDDHAIIADASKGSYADIWTSPFLGRFYRPIVVTLVRGSLDLFGTVAVPLRLLHAILIGATLWTFVSMFRGRVRDGARYAGGLVLLASPLTFVSVSLFAVGIGDLIVGLMFVLSIRAVQQAETGSQRLDVATLIPCSVIALLAKESGTLVAAYCAIEALRRRRLVTVAILCAAVGCYLAFRTTFVPHGSFDFSTGYFFSSYSIEELNSTFGDSPGRLYAYNIVANLLDALIGFPEKGQVQFPVHAALLVPALALTTFSIARYLTLQKQWRVRAPLVSIVLMNAVLGYTYVRPRIMFVAAFALVMLLVHTLDDLLTRPQRVLGIPARSVALGLIALWGVVLINSLVRLVVQGS